MELGGAVVLVTGGSAGIGRAVCLELASAGAVVVVHGRDVRRTQDVADQVNGVAVQADLREYGAVQSLAGEALAAHGRLDVLIANAGQGWSGPFVEMSDEEIADPSPWI